MIQISTAKHQNSASHSFVHSHKFNPNSDVTIFLIIQGDNQSIISIVEEQFLENISGLDWNKSEAQTDLSYITEKYNHFVTNISGVDKENISILLAILVNNSLTLSSIGKVAAILVESKTGAITSIIQKESTHNEFEYITDGEIFPNSSIYLSNKNLEEIFGKDILLEITDFTNDEWTKICKNIGERELQDHLHIFRITCTSSHNQNEIKRVKQHDIIQQGILNIHSFIQKNIWLKKMGILLEEKKNKGYFQYTFLLVGIIILFLLTYSMFGSLFGVISEPKIDIKNRILQAQNLIEQSQKLTNNPYAFNKNIAEAENILLDLKDEKNYTIDIQNLMSRIEAMKKEVNDIQTISLDKYSSLIKFNPNDISPIGVVEYNKKFTLVGKENIILNYVRGENLTKPTAYPVGEFGKTFDITDDGNLFILTENNRILGQKRNDITYVTVTGQNGWESAINLRTFNGNIYLLGEGIGQIYKHKPGINGFSAKTESLENTQTGIVDIAIDGGFFLLYNNGKIGRYISTKSHEIKFLNLNKIPGIYDIGKFNPTQFFFRANLSYIYILSGNKIWIFQPDSKRFQDISALNYVAQIEIQTQEEIRNIFIPRDGTIYITTNLGVYDIQYEIANNKLLLR